jgi:hypothetical protein
MMTHLSLTTMIDLRISDSVASSASVVLLCCIYTVLFLFASSTCACRFACIVRRLCMRMTLETQVTTIESANLNAETMAAMRKGAGALKVIHGNILPRVVLPSRLDEWNLPRVVLPSRLDEWNLPHVAPPSRGDVPSLSSLMFGDLESVSNLPSNSVRNTWNIVAQDYIDMMYIMHVKAKSQFTRFLCQYRRKPRAKDDCPQTRSTHHCHVPSVPFWPTRSASQGGPR